MNDLIQVGADELGAHRQTVAELVSEVGWNDDRFAAELKQPRWVERLWAELVQTKANERARACGPPAMQNLSDGRARELIAPALRAALEEYRGQSALVLGPTGAGKSIFAMLAQRKMVREWARFSIAKQAYDVLALRDDRTERQAVWCDAILLGASVARHPLGKGEPPSMLAAKDAFLLVLDDVCWAERDAASLEVIAHRYNSGLPTICTTGLKREELITRFGDAVVRRMLEVAGVKGLLVEC